MRLNPGLHVIHLSRDVVQVGSGTRSVQVKDCTPAVHAVLDGLAQGVPDGTELELSRQCGLGDGQARTLLVQLRPVLVPTAAGPNTDTGYASDLLASDLASAWARSGQADQLISRRAAATVQVVGLGRTGAAAAQVLASSGVGQLLLADPGTVMVADLGTGYGSADLGRVRAVALSRRLDAVTQGLLVWPAVGDGPVELLGDLTVAISLGGMDRDLISAARAAGHPLLPVVVRDDDVMIGPWSDPVEAGCPECWELWSRHIDPEHADRTAALGQARAGWEETAISTAAGALAASQVLSRVDADGRRSLDGQVLRLGSAGEVQTVLVEPHPSCGCLLAEAFTA